MYSINYKLYIGKTNVEKEQFKISVLDFMMSTNKNK